MADVVLIGGSTSLVSRSSAVLARLEQDLAARSITTARINVRALPAEDVLFGRTESAAIEAAIQALHDASAVVVATPVYKAAYSGILKAFLDLLPQQILRHKAVLPIATGGAPGHLLAIDYALKPVLSALGARYVLSGIYVLDSQIAGSPDAGYTLDPAIGERLEAALEELSAAVTKGGGLVTFAALEQDARR